MGVLVEPPPDPLLGATLMERYLVERKLGEGGMGAVYVARHLVLDKPVALKVLHAELMRKQELRERFLNEARAASRIRHENVIDITDFGTTQEGAVFFAMELLSGRDLHAELADALADGQRLPWQRARAIFLQICSALAAAHRLGIIHRDLKPENIYLIEWLGHRDFVKLLDFGIAKSTEVVDDDRKLTRTGMLFGTPEYMAPEQARGEAPDHRVDVYSMGCLLYQLVTGRVPFTGESFLSVLAQHLAEPAPAIPRQMLVEVGAPVGLDAVVARSLAKDREHRTPSIDTLAAEVRAAEDAARIRRPSAAAPPFQAMTQVIWLPSRAGLAAPLPPPRSRGISLVLAASILAIGAGALISFLSRSDAPAAPPRAHAPASAAATVWPESQAPAVHPLAEPTATIESKPGESKPGEPKPGESKPGESRPGEPKPGDSKPGEPSDSKPGESGESKPGETHPGDPALPATSAAAPTTATPIALTPAAAEERGSRRHRRTDRPAVSDPAARPGSSDTAAAAFNADEPNADDPIDDEPRLGDVKPKDPFQKK